MRNIHPQAHHSVSLCDALDRVLSTGVVALAETTISVADIDLLYLGLQLVITSIETDRSPHGEGVEWSPAGRLPRGCPQALEPTEVGGILQSEPTGSVPAAPTVAEEGRASLPPVGGRLQPTAPHPAGQAPDKSGLGRLVLTLIKVLHELLKRQALRRVQAGSLGSIEMERIGVTLMRQAQEIERLAQELGLKPEDLNLDLGPLGKLL